MERRVGRWSFSTQDVTMAMERQATKRLCQDIGSIQISINLCEGKQIMFHPILDSKITDIDVMGVLCGLACMGHKESTSVVLVEDCSMVLGDTKFIKDRLNI